MLVLLCCKANLLPSCRRALSPIAMPARSMHSSSSIMSQMELRSSHSFQGKHWEFWVPCPKTGGVLPCTQPLGLRSKPPTLATLAWRMRMGCIPCVTTLTAVMCPYNVEKSRPKVIWNGLGFSSRYPFHLSSSGSNFYPVAIFLCFAHSWKSLWKCFRRAAFSLSWTLFQIIFAIVSISSLDEEHSFRLFPFGSALCSAQTTIKHGSLFLCPPMSFISIMDSFPMFLLIFLPQWWIPSVLVPVTQFCFAAHYTWQQLAAGWVPDRAGTPDPLIHTQWGQKAMPIPEQSIELPGCSVLGMEGWIATLLPVVSSF